MGKEVTCRSANCTSACVNQTLGCSAQKDGGFTIMLLLKLDYFLAFFFVNHIEFINVEVLVRSATYCPIKTSLYKQKLGLYLMSGIVVLESKPAQLTIDLHWDVGMAYRFELCNNRLLIIFNILRSALRLANFYDETCSVRKDLCSYHLFIKGWVLLT